MVNKSLSYRLGTISLNVVVAFFGLLIMLPILWMLSASFKPLSEIYRYPPTLLPENFSLGNYERLFSNWPFWRWYFNSLVVAFSLTFAQLFFASLAGFGFAKYRFRGSNALFIILLGSTMIPFPLLLVPLFITMSELRWTDSYYSLTIPFMAPAIGIFLMRQFIISIPTELMESARIDGASEFGIYWRIMLPLMRPALAALAVLQFLGTWNSFLWPLAVLRRTENMVLPVGLEMMSGSITAGTEPPIGASMAAATLVIIPVMIVFVAVQRHYVAGLTAASVKQ
jgi:multiple sugar transport system permease protein